MSALVWTNEILSVVLSYLEVKERFLTARVVDRQWYHAVMHNKQEQLICVQLKKQSRVKRQQKAPCQIKSIELVGRVVEQACDATSTAKSSSSHKLTSLSSRKRTRGHLPEPGMDHYSCTKKLIDATCAFQNNHHGILCSVPGNEDQLLTLNMPESVVIMSDDIHNPDRPNLKGFCRRLSKMVTHLNMSSLESLQHLAIRACSCLTDLVLPSSLESLDAVGCTNLQQIVVPQMRQPQQDEHPIGVQWWSVNLNGCRALRTLGGDRIDAHNLQELDFSACAQLPTQSIVALVQGSQCLESLSLRYIATDAILEALAQSTGVCHSLTLCDVAFSRSLTDTSVTALVQKATQLDRLNLRGCTSVSSYCYNTTPILLQQRRDQQSGMDPVTTATRGATTASLDESDATTRHANHAQRKGDNVFYLASFSSSQDDRKASPK